MKFKDSTVHKRQCHTCANIKKMCCWQILFRFEGIVKNDSFYEQAANGKTRRYFYNVDLNGRLFLGKLSEGMEEECSPPPPPRRPPSSNLSQQCLVQNKRYQRMLPLRSKIRNFSISFFAIYNTRDPENAII